MKRVSALVGLLAVTLAGASHGGAEEGRASRHDPVAQRREPFRIFDNLYYVGNRWVSAYLLTTSEGSILIDALYGEFTEQALEGIRGLGLDPRDIRYVLITHGHYDHAGGAGRLQERLGARIGMTESDWLLVESGEEVGEIHFEPPRRDLVLRDSDTITIGETTVTLRVTPGHTLGVLSLQFEVLDGEERHDAFLFGGVGLNFSGVAQTRQYLESVRRIRAIEGIEVNLTNHPGVGRVFQRAERLGSRRPGEPHPFVARADFLTWLDDLEAGARKKLREERRAAESNQGDRVNDLQGGVAQSARPCTIVRAEGTRRAPADPETEDGTHGPAVTGDGDRFAKRETGEVRRWRVDGRSEGSSSSFCSP